MIVRAIRQNNFVIPANTVSSTQTHTYSDIPAGSICIVTETANGATGAVGVIVTGSGAQVTIPSGSSVTAALTDTYSLNRGSLTIFNRILGPAAGSQGAITIQPTCPGIVLLPFTIPAGGTSQTRTYSVPANTTCTITETVDGSNTQTTVVVGSGQQVTVPAGGGAFATITDTYSFADGSLTVNKAIAGPAAGQQGQITIDVTCNGTPLDPFVIPAGTAAGTVSHTYTGLPGNAVCTVLETADGHTSTVTARAGGNGQDVTIPPGGTATADLTDTYASGSLIVNKTITGAAAGSQGAITIHVVCNGVAQDDFTIPAGATESASHEYDNIIAGATCVVTETADGSTSTVNVATEGSPQTVTISANGSATANLTDTYTFVPGSLTVTKDITGPAAGQQGAVTIEVLCGDANTPLDPPFEIDAGSTGPASHTYTDIPGNTTCDVQETVDGHSQTVSVSVDGTGEVAIPAAGEATATVTDTYDLVPGVLIVDKTITGAAAGNQGPVTIGVTCDGTAQPDFTIDAGSAADTYHHEYTVPAGASCTVSETADGTTSTVVVTVDGNNQTVTVPGATVVPVALTDTYTDAPGSLLVTKTIAGAAAGSQGEIAILVDCGGPPQVFAFLIPAGSPAGPVPRAYDGLAAGSTCTVTEVVDGSTSEVDVVGEGSGQSVGVPAGGAASADMKDTFTAVSPVTEASMSTTTTTPVSTVAPEATATAPASSGELPFTGLALSWI